MFNECGFSTIQRPILDLDQEFTAPEERTWTNISKCIIDCGCPVQPSGLLHDPLVYILHEPFMATDMLIDS